MSDSAEGWCAAGNLGASRVSIRGMVCSRQPRSFQGVDPHGRLDGWTEDGWRDGWRDARIQGRLHFSSRLPLLYRMFFTGLYFGAFICLAFLVDGLPSLLFYIQGFSSFFLFQLFEKKCWCGATRVEQLLSMRDKLFFRSKNIDWAQYTN